jgi:CRP-like cAMP-binding protein
MNPTEVRQVRQKLGQGRWFGGLPAALQQQLLVCAELLEFAKGEFILREGVAADALYAVVDGQVKALRSGGGDKPALLYVGERGLWFGEHALLTDMPRLINVVACRKTRVLQVAKADVERIVEAEPRYYRDMVRLGMRRAAIYLEAYAQAASLAPEQRLLGRLALLTRLRQDEQPDQDPVELPLSQVDLAAIVGVTRQTINPLVRAMADRGLIELRFGRIRVLDPVGLWGVRPG